MRKLALKAHPSSQTMVHSHVEPSSMLISTASGYLAGSLSAVCSPLVGFVPAGSGMLAVANDVATKEWHQLNDRLVVLHSCALFHQEVHNLSRLR